MEDLNDEQKEMVKYRRKLLDLLDKLQTYEIILEAPTMYDKNLYQEFRKLSALENAVRYEQAKQTKDSTTKS